MRNLINVSLLFSLCWRMSLWSCLYVSYYRLFSWAYGLCWNNGNFCSWEKLWSSLIWNDPISPTMWMFAVLIGDLYTCMFSFDLASMMYILLLCGKEWTSLKIPWLLAWCGYLWKRLMNIELWNLKACYCEHITMNDVVDFLEPNKIHCKWN